ncbi:hypothetical protein CSUB01_09213 [Colletotrichum sublineola]|uniref:Uncharacterized protein n=1 Tax=Colletotrichum sublineola TaxID=1173701 RepID=A0A066XMI4_COLSU|nr:hypothetical protein CSUB01_09213 [Colletotrichum sublineola]
MTWDRHMMAVWELEVPWVGWLGESMDGKWTDGVVGSEDDAGNIDNNGSWAQRGTSNLVGIISIISILPLNNDRGEEVKKLVCGRRRLNNVAEQAVEVALAWQPGRVCRRPRQRGAVNIKQVTFPFQNTNQTDFIRLLFVAARSHLRRLRAPSQGGLMERHCGRLAGGTAAGPAQRI